MTLDPSVCWCTGCDHCSPERGRCQRPSGDYPDHQCPPCHERNAELWAQTQPLSLEIDLLDIVGPTGIAITPGTGTLVISGGTPGVELTAEQRSFWKRLFEKLLRLIPSVAEVGVEISPDGTMRIYIKPKT